MDLKHASSVAKPTHLDTVEVFVSLALLLALFIPRISWMFVDLMSFWGESIRRLSSVGDIVKVFIIISRGFQVDFKSLGRHTGGQVFFQVFSLSSTQILFGFFFLWLFFNVRKYFFLFIATNDSPNIFLIFSLSERLKRTRVFYQLASFWSERKVFQYFVRFTFGLVLWSWANILLVWK